MIVWDKTKREKNLRAHGIDLAEVGSYSMPQWSRWKTNVSSTANSACKAWRWFRNRVVFLVWTERDESARVISCRYGDKHETRAYFEALGF